MPRILVLSLVLTAALSAGLAAQDKGAVKKVTPATEGTTPPPPIKIALSGKPLNKYSQARTAALGNLSVQKCSTFLTGHGFDPAQVSHALEVQLPQDGLASSISFQAAGIIGSVQDPHSGDSVQSIFKDQNFLTMAISQPRGKETYYNRDLLMRKISYPYSNSVSVIHEALHNLTGESDVAIAQDFGYRGFGALEANIFLNDTLKKYCDSKH